MLERLADYAKKLHVIRQIMSNKARRYAALNTAANLTTVVVSSLLTFMGFSGLQRVQAYVSLITPVEQATVELVFNLLVFSLFVLLVLHLVFRFGSKQAEAERAIVTLTHLVNEIDDMFAQAEHGIPVSQADLNTVRNRYDTLLQVLPANSDREYLRAKKDYQDKEQKKATLQLDARELFDVTAQKRALQALLRHSTTLSQVLEGLRRVDERLYLGGGLIRNAVWDHLHGYRSATPIDDVDVVYFDSVGATKQHDRAIEHKLRTVIPNLKWSVKNQARMHEQNRDNPYRSLEDAVSQWPETATAVVVRLTADGELEVIAPHGYSDLFRLIVAPTERFRAKLDRYQQRIREKNWSAQWPRLRFFDTEPSRTGPANTPPRRRAPEGNSSARG